MHTDRIRHEIFIDDEQRARDTISVVIHGDPLPRVRQLLVLEYDESEENALQSFFTHLKKKTTNHLRFRGQIILNVEVTFLIKETDRYVSQTLYHPLAETIGFTMSQCFFDYGFQISDTSFFIGVADNFDAETGKILVKLSVRTVNEGNF